MYSIRLSKDQSVGGELLIAATFEDLSASFTRQADSDFFGALTICWGLVRRTSLEAGQGAD
jgi:hypothetical protein